MSTDFLPRTLIVAIEPINRKGPTGITLSNLFSGWPKDSLAQIYNQEEEPDTEICSRSFQLDPRTAPWGYCVRRMIGNNTLRSAPETPGLTTMNAGISVGGRACLHMVARGINDASPILLPTALKHWVHEFAPDVIYSPLGSIRVMNYLLAVTQIAGSPVVPHFMDDWPATMYSEGILLRYPRRVLHRRLTQVLALSPVGICIGEEMAQEYRQRYGMPFGHMMNCIGEKDFVAAKPSYPKRPLVSYIGRLHLERWKPLLTIARAAADLGCEMRIFAPPEDLKTCIGRFSDIANLRIGSLAPEDVFGEMQHADVVVHVESFDLIHIAYTRLSVSTKIPQYMAAGKPILACGPERLASMKMIRKADAGVVVGCNELEPIRSALKSLQEDPQYRFRLAKNGHEYARQFHSQSAVQKRFRALLAEAALARPQGGGLQFAD